MCCFLIQRLPNWTVIPFLVPSYIQEVQQDCVEALVYEPHQSTTNVAPEDRAFLASQQQTRKDCRRCRYRHRRYSLVAFAKRHQIVRTPCYREGTWTHLGEWRWSIDLRSIGPSFTNRQRYIVVARQTYRTCCKQTLWQGPRCSTLAHPPIRTIKGTQIRTCSRSPTKLWLQEVNLRIGVLTCILLLCLSLVHAIHWSQQLHTSKHCLIGSKCRTVKQKHRETWISYNFDSNLYLVMFMK